MQAAVVLQARFGSSRLPGKVLARIGQSTLLEHCIRRLACAGLPVIVATTERPDDDAVAREAEAYGVEVFRGAELDVLARYLAAARAYALTHVVRATADNPFVDSGAVERVLVQMAGTDVDHAGEGGLPIGAGVEGVRVEALQRASVLSSDPYDHEHVTPFIRRDARFRSVHVVAPHELRRADLRLTVDTADDLAHARRLHAELGGDVLAPLAAVIAAADRLAATGVGQPVMQGA